MPSLPTPGADDGVWGTELNAFLETSLNPDGTINKTAIESAGGLVNTSNLAEVSNAGTSRSNLHINILSGCQAVGVVNVSLTSPGPIFGGFTLSNVGTDQVLLINQSVAAQNGPWVWNGAASALTRPTDYPTGASVGRRMVQINNNAGPVCYDQTLWLSTNLVSAVVDTGATQWVQANSGVYAAQQSTYNFPYIHRALANVSNNTTGDRSVLLIGDSTTYGFNGVNGIGAAQGLAKLMTQAGVPSQLGLAIPKSPLVVTAADTRWSVGTGWSQVVGQFVWAALSPTYVCAAGAAANTLTFTPSGGFAYDTFTIWYLRVPGGGIFHAGIDSGSQTAQSTSGAIGVASVTITGSVATNHVLNLGNNTGAGTATIIGVEPSLSTQPTMRIANVGVSGATTINWTNQLHAGAGPLDCIEAYAPDVTIINLGINDADTGVTPAGYIANLTTLVAACQGSGDVIVASPIPSEIGAGNPAIQAQYALELPQFCYQNNCKFLDLFNQWGGVAGYAKLNPLSYYWDGFHPSQNVGYPDVARAYAGALLGA